MHSSLNEIASLVTKAVRGAGATHGASEDAAFSIVRLFEFGFDATADLAEALTRIDDGKDEYGTVRQGDAGWTWSPGSQDTSVSSTLVSAAPTDLVNTGRDNAVLIEKLVFPALLLPHASARAVTLKSDVSLVQDCAVTCRSDGTICGDVEKLIASAEPKSIRITAKSPEPAATPCISRQALLNGVKLDDAVHTRLSAFAHRTYVPATEASRLLGAGAGLTDND